MHYQERLGEALEYLLQVLRARQYESYRLALHVSAEGFQVSASDLSKAHHKHRKERGKPLFEPQTKFCGPKDPRDWCVIGIPKPMVFRNDYELISWFENQERDSY